METAMVSVKISWKLILQILGKINLGESYYLRSLFHFIDTKFVTYLMWCFLPFLILETDKKL